MEPATRAAWAQHVGASKAAAAALDALVARYAEPHRAYHGVDHLDQIVAGCLTLLGGPPGAAVADHGTVVLAAFFHDAVYDPSSATNETDSAELAEQELERLGVRAARRAEVARLVRATAPLAATVAGAGDDPAANVLLDADLAVLGADAAAYARYVEQIRAEYAHLDDASWRAGRCAVLRALLARPALYRTEVFREREQRARHNLGAELEALSRGGSRPGVTERSVQ